MIGAEQLPAEGDKRGWLFFQAGFLGFQARQFEQFFDQPASFLYRFQNQFEAASDAIVQGSTVLADEVFQRGRDQGDGRPEFVGDIGRSGTSFRPVAELRPALRSGPLSPWIFRVRFATSSSSRRLQLFVAGPDQAKPKRAGWPAGGNQGCL